MDTQESTTRKNNTHAAGAAPEPAGFQKPLNGKLADPAWRQERATKASAAAHSVSTYVRQVVARAPDLTAEDAALLRSILPPVPTSGDGHAA